jgi:hypothetical protein
MGYDAVQTDVHVPTFRGSCCLHFGGSLHSPWTTRKVEAVRYQTPRRQHRRKNLKSGIVGSGVQGT